MNQASSESILETERLRLRQITESDCDELLEIWADAQAMRLFPKVLDRAEMQAWMERNEQRYEEYGYGLWAVILQETGEFIGDCGLVWQEVEGVRELEVGYHFKPRFWGRGLATEAARGCIDYAFEQLGCRRVISMIRPENLASRCVAERNGLRVERQIEWRGYQHLVYAIER